MTEITQTSFDQFLALLDADDRERAGAKYEALRLRLIKFFEWRNCETAEELSDVVFNRIAKKISEGELIQNVNAYAASVAQFVLKEHLRAAGRSRVGQIEENAETKNPREDEVFGRDDHRRMCLQRCLAQMDPEAQKLLLAYHDTDEKTMIAARRRLADSLGVSLNTLRIRVCRLKSKLEDCVFECCKKF